MSKKTSRVIKYFLCLLIVMVALSGCGFIQELSLTEEEQDLIAEYSAGLLMRYNAGHANGLVRVDDVVFDDLNVEVTPTPIPDALVPPVDENGEEGAGQGPDEDISGEVPDTESDEAVVDINMTPMNEAFGLNGVELVASYIELVDSYPATGEDLLLSMNAVEGKELLILHFDVSNTSGQDMSVATNLGEKKVRALVNGTDKLRCEITLLSNDLLNYSNTLAPGAKDDEVLVFEKDKDEEISSLTLVLVGGEEELRYNLY